MTTPNCSEKNRWKEDLYNFSADSSLSLNPPLKACSVAINISPENRVYNKILGVVSQRWEFDSENCFIHALGLLREIIHSVPYCIFCTQEYSWMFPYRGPGQNNVHNNDVKAKIHPPP